MHGAAVEPDLDQLGVGWACGRAATSGVHRHGHRSPTVSRSGPQAQTLTAENTMSTKAPFRIYESSLPSDAITACWKQVPRWVVWLPTAVYALSHQICDMMPVLQKLPTSVSFLLTRHLRQCMVYEGCYDYVPALYRVYQMPFQMRLRPFN